MPGPGGSLPWPGLWEIWAGMGRHLPAILGLLALLGHGSSDQGRCLLASDIQELLHVNFLQQACLGLRLRAVQTMGAWKKFMLEKFMYVFSPLIRIKKIPYEDGC